MKKVLFIAILVIAVFVIYLALGSEVTKNVDDYVYELPFKKGTSHRIVQGYGGHFSHKNKAALDFYMSEGTEIYAAREGTIYAYKEDSDEGGPFSKYERKAN